MKKILLSFVALFATTILSAQPQFATVEHNGDFTAYYGINAFRQAYEQADTGDVITLSAGYFNSINIEKPLVIRGTGFEYDSVAATERTILHGDFNVSIDDSVNHLKLEGVYFSGYVKICTLYHAEIVKCYINVLDYMSGGHSVMRNCTFINVYTREMRLQPQHMNNQFINCIIETINTHYGAYNSLVNCFCVMDCGWVQYFNSYNSIFANSHYRSYNLSMVQSTYNCIGISHVSSVQFFAGEVLSPHNLWNFRSTGDVFKPNTTYELIDSIAATHLGTDGTQIGIYGGAYPFSSSVRHPLLGKVSPAQQTRADGKLEVEVELTPAN